MTETDEGTRTTVAAAPLHRARHAKVSRLMPCCWTTGRGTQQSSMDSWYHLHGPFQTLPGSMLSALRTMARVPRPQ
jgi:hypothetical protein